MYQLIIKNAKTTDGDLIDIAINDGKIVQLGHLTPDQKGQKSLDLAGEYFVSAGWIDAHTHCFSDSPIYYDDPDAAGAETGVTTVVDAGSVGAIDIDHFYQLTQKSKTHVYAFLNIAKQGIISQNELSDMAMIDDNALRDAVKRHPHFVIGLKARMSKSVVGENGIQPLIRAKEMQKQNGDLPLMVHIGNNPPNLDEIADLLTKGDIITHCFNGKPNRILDKNGELKESIKRALARGVILDVGHGGESFSFSVAEQAMRLGTYPDLISSDIYHRNRINGPVYNLAAVMTKFLCMGVSLKQVIACVTEKAATLLHLGNKGFLAVGYDADLTIFKIKDEKIILSDAEGEIREGNQKIEAIAAIIGGEYIPINHEQDHSHRTQTACGCEHDE